jgi:hypothetical protein
MEAVFHESTSWMLQSLATLVKRANSISSLAYQVQDIAYLLHFISHFGAHMTERVGVEWKEPTHHQLCGEKSEVDCGKLEWRGSTGVTALHSRRWGKSKLCPRSSLQIPTLLQLWGEADMSTIIGCYLNINIETASPPSLKLSDYSTKEEQTESCCSWQRPKAFM